jgi:hypothetical protein
VSTKDRPPAELGDVVQATRDVESAVQSVESAVEEVKAGVDDLKESSEAMVAQIRVLASTLDFGLIVLALLLLPVAIRACQELR